MDPGEVEAAEVANKEERHLAGMIEAVVVVAQRVHGQRPSRENSLVITKLEEAEMWSERDLERKSGT